MAQSFSTKTETLINDARSVYELNSIMQQISLSDIKQFVLDQTVQSMNTDKVRSIYYESASIQDILSNDELQSILIFVADQESIKSVSELFKQLKAKNDILMRPIRQKKRIEEFYTQYKLIENAKSMCNKYSSSKIYRIKSPKSAWMLFNEYKINDQIGDKYACAKAQLIRRKQKNEKNWKYHMTAEEKSQWQGIVLREKAEWEKVTTQFAEHKDYSNVPPRWLEEIKDSK